MRRRFRYIKKSGEATRADISESTGITKGALSPILRDMCELEVLVFREEQRGPGRPARIYRLQVEEEQPKSEYVRETPLTDAELLEQYPESFKETITEEPMTVKEKLEKRTRVTVETPRVEPVSPDAWKAIPKGAQLPPPPKERPPRREPPLVLDQELIEDFMEAVYNMAVLEGFNVKSKKPIDGQEPGLWLENEIEEVLDAWRISREKGGPVLKNLVAIGLRACHLYHRHRERA